MIDTSAGPDLPDGSATRRTLSPLVAALLAIAGNILVVAIVAIAIVAVLAAGIVVFGPVVAGV